MSITTDLKNYVDQTVSTAQSQLNDVAGTANDYLGKYRENVGDIAEKANDAVSDLRINAEKAINADALRTAVEPYLAQAREYGSAVTDRAEGLLNGVKDDPRLARVVDTANAVSAIVLEQVNTYVVKPVRSITGLGQQPTAKRSTPKPAKAATTKPAGTRRPSAAKSTARKAPAKSTSSARKSTAAKSTASKSTASKSTASKATPRTTKS